MGGWVVGGWWVGEKKTKLMLYSTLVEIEVEVGVELGNCSCSTWAPSNGADELVIFWRHSYWMNFRHLDFKHTPCTFPHICTGVFDCWSLYMPYDSVLHLSHLIAKILPDIQFWTEASCKKLKYKAFDKLRVLDRTCSAWSRGRPPPNWRSNIFCGNDISFWHMLVWGWYFPRKPTNFVRMKFSKSQEILKSMR